MRKPTPHKEFIKKTLWIAVPIMIQNAITNFVGMLDNIMVGQIGTNQMTGVNITISGAIMWMYTIAIFSLYIVATVFGVISPKIRTISVNSPVATPMKLLPKTSVVNVVARADAVILTILLPTRIVLNILEGFSSTLKTLKAERFPSSERALNLCLLTVVSAVSADEKNADKITIITIAINCITDPGSKNDHSP
jgi:hypothetical protein